MRVVISLEYDGSPYWGWQRQSTRMGIQPVVEKALSLVADEPVQVFCAGRTDKGVHATTQVIHFNAEKVRSERAWVMGANAYLPKSIRVHWAREVSSDFHARFSAMRRRYCYILQVSLIPPAILEPYVSWRYGQAEDLDEIAIVKACESLLGQQDFSSFRAADCQAKTPIRTIHVCRFSRQNNLFILDIEADGFLHHMVRNIMGVLIEIGLGKKPAKWIDEVLGARDRRAASKTAVPNGLYLTHITYPAHFALPIVLRRPLFLR